MPTMPEQTTKLADKYQQHRKAFYLFVCVLTVVLSIAGVCIAYDDVKVSQELYITILFFSLLCLAIEVVFRILRSSGAHSKYEVSERKDETDAAVNAATEKKVEKKESANGVDNKAYDAAEKGAGGADTKDEKWVKNYVPYDEYPAGKDGEAAAAAASGADTVTVESETTGEEKRREEEKGEKETKEEKKDEKGGDEKWKDNNVPYNEEDKE